MTPIECSVPARSLLSSPDENSKALDPNTQYTSELTQVTRVPGKLWADRNTHPADLSSSELRLCLQPLQQQFQVGKNASASPRVKIIMKDFLKSDAHASGDHPDLSPVFVPCCCPIQSYGLQYLHRDLSLNPSEPMSTLTNP